MTRESDAAAAALTFEDAAIALGRPGAFPKHPRLVSAPALAALRAAGTAHVYADTASVEELGGLLARENGIVAEVDGNTANQPLVHKVIEGYLERGDAAAWAAGLRRHRPDLPERDLLPLLYAVVCGRVGNDIIRAFSSHRVWEVSLQLHMGLVGRPGPAGEIAHLLRRMVPSAFVKVPFTPQAPDCFLLARDLERDGIPVNFTSTFSARQAVAAALLADATRTNIFMGRLDQGLQAERLGEHVDLEAQRALRRLRAEDGVKTHLIVASMREWQTFARTAGCDVYTAPCSVIADFLSQRETPPEEITSRLETSYEDRLGVSEEVEKKLGAERIARLYRVEPELLEFLREYRRSRDYRDLDLRGGEALRRRFEEAGFGDLFHTPDEPEWKEMRRSKLPDLDSPRATAIALDTHYSLLADADFEKYQEEMDRAIGERL